MKDRIPGNEANTLPEIQDALSKIDTGQDALIESSLTLQQQNAVIITLLDQLVALITPKEGQQEGPHLDELLARMIAQQTMIIDLSKRTVEAPRRTPKIDSASTNFGIAAEPPVSGFSRRPQRGASTINGRRSPRCPR